MPPAPADTSPLAAVRVLCAAHAAVFGILYMLLPATSSTLAVIAATGVPFPVYGALFAAAGLAGWWWPATSHAALCGMWTLWSAGQAATVLTGELAAPGGIVHAALVAALHGLILAQLTTARRNGAPGRHAR
ncbi:MAG: hypothetical protein ACRCZP_17620 [Phycicoccus sp.]